MIGGAGRDVTPLATSEVLLHRVERRLAVVELLLEVGLRGRPAVVRAVRDARDLPVHLAALRVELARCALKSAAFLPVELGALGLQLLRPGVDLRDALLRLRVEVAALLREVGLRVRDVLLCFRVREVLVRSSFGVVRLMLARGLRALVVLFDGGAVLLARDSVSAVFAFLAGSSRNQRGRRRRDRECKRRQFDSSSCRRSSAMPVPPSSASRSPEKTGAAAPASQVARGRAAREAP